MIVGSLLLVPGNNVTARSTGRSLPKWVMDGYGYGYYQVGYSYCMCYSTGLGTVLSTGTWYRDEYLVPVPYRTGRYQRIIETIRLDLRVDYLYDVLYSGYIPGR